MVDEILDIQAQLEAAKARQVELELQLIEKQRAAQAGVLEQITRLAQSAGLTADQVSKHFATTTKAPKAEKLNGAVVKPRAVWRDTITGGEYRGGKIPGWLADRLQTMGMSLDAYRAAGHMARVS